MPPGDLLLEYRLAADLAFRHFRARRSTVQDSVSTSTRDGIRPEVLRDARQACTRALRRDEKPITTIR